MEIVVCGVSHKTAPVEMLERLSFAPDSHARVLAQLANRREGEAPLAHEAVLLSTCNRVELYAVLGDGSGPEPIARFLADFHGMSYPVLAAHVYGFSGQEAARHLFDVASGLDSMILGEPQILGQVRSAYEKARKLGATGAVLSSLFRHAIVTAKRVHTETTISQRATSVSYAAVEVAAQHFERLCDKQVLLVGSGKTGQLTAGCLLGRGIHDITVANRTLDPAQALAARWKGQAIGLEQVPEAMGGADIVISATDAPGYLIDAAQVQAAMATRTGRPLLLIDIAIPRDIDPACGSLPGVTLYNLEDLKTTVELNLRDRDKDRATAQAIVDEEVAGFMAWLNARAVTPAIVNLREHAEAIRQREMERTVRRLNGVPAHDAELVDMLTQRIVNQLLHEPTVRLKRYAGHNRARPYVQALSDLFALNDPTDRK